MKKLLALIIVLAMLPVAVLADESAVVGCWAHYELMKSGAPEMTVLYLAADHTCYYLVQTYSLTEADFGRTYVGTWVINDDGDIDAKIGNNARMTLTLSKSGAAAICKSTGEIFVNLTALGV